MMANWVGGTTHVGVTTDLVRRVHQHRTGALDWFTKRFRLTRLVYFEEHAPILSAIQREKNVKGCQRAWKVALIEAGNPDWRDLWPEII